MKNENRTNWHNCVNCNYGRPKAIKNAGRSRTQLPNGQWSEETVCDMYKIKCVLDGEIQGRVFTPYDTLKPLLCPMDQKKITLRKLFFYYFF